MIKRSILFIIILLNSITTFAAPQIYHGDPVINEEQFPFVAAIYHFDSKTKIPKPLHSAVCTGSLIAKNWVLTARHCVYDHEHKKYRKPSEISIGFGFRAGIQGFSKRAITVLNIYVMDNKRIFDLNSGKNKHRTQKQLEEIKQYFMHDVALLKLSEPVNDVIPVNLPNDSGDYPDLKLTNQKATAIGYGYDDMYLLPPNKGESVGMTLSGYLHSGDEIIQSDDAIRQIFIEENAEEEIELYDEDTMLGVTSPDEKITTNGDSGGPLVIASAGATPQPYTQVGVTSWKLPPSYENWRKGYLTKGPSMSVKLTNPEILNFIKTTIGIKPSDTPDK